MVPGPWELSDGCLPERAGLHPPVGLAGYLQIHTAHGCVAESSWRTSTRYPWLRMLLASRAAAWLSAKAAAGTQEMSLARAGFGGVGSMAVGFGQGADFGPTASSVASGSGGGLDASTTRPGGPPPVLSVPAAPQ